MDGLLSETIFASEQVSGKAGQAPGAHGAVNGVAAQQEPGQGVAHLLRGLGGRRRTTSSTLASSSRLSLR
jgi:hypothetical protein